MVIAKNPEAVISALHPEKASGTRSAHAMAAAKKGRSARSRQAHLRQIAE
jgi:hypothetical protein